MKSIFVLIGVFIFSMHTNAEPGRLGSTRGETEFTRPGERSVENEFPEEVPETKRPEPTVELGRRVDEIPPVDSELETDKFMSAHVNPFTSLFGLIYADAGFAIKDKFTVGPAIRIAKYNIFFLREDSLGLGARAAWFNRGPFQSSFYVATTPLFSWGRVISNAFSTRAEAKFSRFYMDLTGGYQWHWKSFNFGLGAGIAFNSVTLSELSGEAGNLKGDIPTFGFTSAAGVFPTAEFVLGWSF